MNEIDTLLSIIRRLEKKVPKLHSNNDYWQGYKDVIEELWAEVDKLESESNR
jgi:hypothetical protein